MPIFLGKSPTESQVYLLSLIHISETRNRSNVAFRTDFIRFKVVDKKVPKRTAIQERVIDAVRSYNEVLVTEGKSDVRTVYAAVSYTHLDVYKRQRHVCPENMILTNTTTIFMKA